MMVRPRDVLCKLVIRACSTMCESVSRVLQSRMQIKRQAAGEERERHQPNVTDLFLRCAPHIHDDIRRRAVRQGSNCRCSMLRRRGIDGPSFGIARNSRRAKGCSLDKMFMNLSIPRQEPLRRMPLWRLECCRQSGCDRTRRWPREAPRKSRRARQRRIARGDELRPNRPVPPPAQLQR